VEQSSLNFETPALAPEAAAVLSMLHHGRQAAVSSTEIERRTGLRPRRIQQVVRKLRLEHGYSIGSATQEPKGYYLTHAQGENADMSKKLRKRALKVLMLSAQFTKRSLRMEFDQAVLEQEKEGK
jgi:hypothetical protein